MSLIDRLFGAGKDLDALQMGMRALVVFFITLALVRLAGMRAFGRKSPFDTILVITLGAVLSRAISGASPFWATIAASSVLVVTHRLIAVVTVRWSWLERRIKGQPTVLSRHGEIDHRAMLISGISEGDLDEAARAQAHATRFTEVDQIMIETSGELTVAERAAPRRSARERARLISGRRGRGGAGGRLHRATPARFRK